MARSKAPNGGGDEPHFPNLTKVTEVCPTTPNYVLPNKASGSALTASPKLASAGSSRTTSVTTKALPSDVEATPKDWVKFGSKLRNELAQSDLEHDDDATPKIRNPWDTDFDPDHDHDHDDREETPTGPAKRGSEFRNPYLDHDREGGSTEPPNPGNRPHDKFDTISVHTAKCDQCGGRNKKVVQRCKLCNLQFCRECLEKNHDGQHFANVEALDWTPKPMIRSKRTNEETKKKKAVATKVAASKTPKQASPGVATRAPSERVQIAEARRRSTTGIPADDDMIDNMHEKVPRHRQRFDDLEYNEGAPSKFKRHYSDDEDDDRVSKKSRGGREVDPEYTYGEYSDEDFAEAKARYSHERRRPRDPHEDIERSGSRQSINRAQPMGFASTAGTRLGARELAAPIPGPSSRPSPQNGRSRGMSYAEAIAAAIEQKREAQRKAEEAHRQEIMKAAQDNPFIAEMLEKGQFDEVDELLEVAAALKHMGEAR